MSLITQSQRQRRIVAGVIEQARNLSVFLDNLDPSDFQRQSVIPRWRTNRIVALLVLMESDLDTALNRATAERPVPLVEYFSGLRPIQRRQAELATELADDESGPGLTAQFAQNLDSISLRLTGADLPDVVCTDPHPIRTVDLMRVTAIALILASDDLSRSLPDAGPMGWSRQATADAVRTLTDTITYRYPGRSVELRVPPFAAVQCGPEENAPRHTRGTPPNVVECDALTLIRVCRGRVRFADAVARGSIRASGTRSDLSSWLPLF